MALLTTAVKQFRQAKSEIGATLTEDQIKLLRTQSLHDTKYGCLVTGASLNDTLKLLMRKKDWKEMDDMVKKFKVPERRSERLKVYKKL